MTMTRFIEFARAVARRWRGEANERVAPPTPPEPPAPEYRMQTFGVAHDDGKWIVPAENFGSQSLRIDGWTPPQAQDERQVMVWEDDGGAE